MRSCGNIKHIVSCSLGKDSVAMLLMMIEKKMQIDEIVWANTSLEFPENFDYKRKLENYIGRKIIVVKPTTTFNYWFYGQFTKGKKKGEIRGMPYVLTKGGYCCREFKAKPLDTIQKLYDGDCTYYIGFAYDETSRTLKSRKNITFRFPLRDWKITEQDCFDYLERKQMLNPLYYRFKRIGCWLCPKQSLASLRSLWKYYPKLWEKLKQYERDSPHGYRIGDKLTSLERRWLQEDIFWNQQLVLNGKELW